MATGFQQIGGDKAFAQITGIGQLTRRALRQAMFKSGHDLRTEASQEILKKPKSGRIYIRRDRSGRRRRHQASAPGETHANMTGTLRRSLSFQLRGSKQLEFGYGVSSGNAPDYAPFVEFGTRRMKARPSLRNAIKASRGNIIRNFNRELKKIGK